MNKKVRAFTIMEVTIAMLLASIVIGITYSTYLIVGRSYDSYFRKNNRLGQLIMFEQFLTKDLARASVIRKDSSSIAIVVDRLQIKYEFQPDYIIRHGVLKDTFKFKPDSVTMSFRGHILEQVSTDTARNFLDGISFYVTLENERIPYHYQKLYSADELIKHLPDAIN